MNYYLRRTIQSEVQGPMSLVEINEGLEAGNLSDEWLATADLEEGLQRIKRLPAHDWTPLSKIPGTLAFVEKPVPEVVPSPPLPTGCRCLLWVVAMFFVAWALLYAACGGRRWI